jgi:uncharacterized protein YicC (UPF0701 family)
LQADIAVAVGTAREHVLGAVQRVEDVTAEKFSSIDRQFAERDIRSEQDKKASKEALDAALLAQKESVAQQNEANTKAGEKTETNTTKQIDQITILITTLEKSLTDRITELKERIDRGEGGTAGAAVQRTESRLTQGAIVGYVVAAFFLISTVVAVIALVVKK